MPDRPALQNMNGGQLVDWLVDAGAALSVVVVLALAGVWLLRRLLPRAVASAVVRNATPQTEIDLRKRADTLGTVLVRTGEIVILVITALVLLDRAAITVAPFLTGLGIGGIAVGLGAQSLVRDMLAGIFILVENQYGRGDLVTVAGVQGWVEDVSLRRTVLRDADGTLHNVPNGEIKVASNLTRGYSGISLLLPLAPATDLGRAMALIDQVGAELATDPVFGPRLVEPPRAARVDGLTDTSVQVRVLGRALPGAQIELAGELRRRIKLAFDAAEIRLGGSPPPAAPPTPAGSPAAPRP